MLPKVIWLAGSAIFCLLGSLHLYYIFFTHKLDPRDEEVIDRMKNTPLRLTRETTTWKAWVGFNASHAGGAIFIGLINGILAIESFSTLENSFFLSFCTVITSIFYLWLARKYWFSRPFIGLALATACFVASPVISFFS